MMNKLTQEQMLEIIKQYQERWGEIIDIDLDVDLQTINTGQVYIERRATGIERLTITYRAKKQDANATTA